MKTINDIERLRSQRAPGAVRGTATDAIALAHDLHYAAERATSIPTVLDTRSCRVEAGARALDVWRQPRASSAVSDPLARHLTAACGGAAFAAELALVERGRHIVIARLPFPSIPDLVCRLTVTRRPTNADAQLADLASAARHQRLDRWIGPDPGHAGDAPAPSVVIERLAGLAFRHGVWLWRIRDRDLIDALRPSENPSSSPELLVLGTHDDHECDWLQAGEALEHGFLELVRAGYTGRVRSLVTDEPETMVLRQRTRRAGWPLFLLEVAPAKVRRSELSPYAR